jgi:hypothetical protein
MFGIAFVIKFVLFVLSTGIWFRQMFGKNPAAVLIAGMVALASFLLVVDEVSGHVISKKLSDGFVDPWRVSPTRGTEPDTAPIRRDEAEAIFQKYLAAWQSGDVNTQAELLAPTFTYIDQERIRQSRIEYLRQKRELASKYGASRFARNIRISVTNLTIELHGLSAVVSYDQYYESPYYSSFGRNKLLIQKRFGVLKIAEEIFDRRQFARRN